MRTYLFVDGPLAGQTASLDVQPPGEAVVIEVVDFGVEPSAPATFEYVFSTEAAQEHPGALRFLDREPEPVPEADQVRLPGHVEATERGLRP